MTLRITDFTGIAPVVAPHKLAPLAQVAKNAQLERGQLEAMKGNAFVASTQLNNVQSIAR